MKTRIAVRIREHSSNTVNGISIVIMAGLLSGARPDMPTAIDCRNNI